MQVTAHVLLSVFALTVGVGHMAVILVHLLGLIREGRASFVSDLLSHNRLYMNLNTFFVLLQFTACFGFVRLHSRTSSAARVATESLFLSLSWFGWCVLILRYEDGSNGVSKLHFLGVGLFVGGGVVYFAFLMWELYVANERECFSGLLLLLYAASVVLGALFILGYFLGWESAWICEHCGFAVFSLSHSYLFFLDVSNGEENPDAPEFCSDFHFEEKTVCPGLKMKLPGVFGSG
jgi:hypothetical protein